MKSAGFGRLRRICQQQRRNPGVFELPFEKFPHVNVQGGGYGNTLQAASYIGQENVELLISKGADVNAQGERLGNALQGASYGGYEKIVELLLSRGCRREHMKLRAQASTLFEHHNLESSATEIAGLRPKICNQKFLFNMC
jgi:ankyrin repeat protein